MFSPPENTSDFPIPVSMIPRPARVTCGGCPAASSGSTGGVGTDCSAPSLCISCRLLFLFRSQPSDFVDECLHHICPSLSLRLSLSPLLSCHAHDSRCATQRQLHYHVEWKILKSTACASNTKSVMRNRQADMDDKSSATTNKPSNANQSCVLSHANA